MNLLTVPLLWQGLYTPVIRVKCLTRNSDSDLTCLSLNKARGCAPGGALRVAEVITVFASEFLAVSPELRHLHGQSLPLTGSN